MADFSLNLNINGVDTAINSIDQLEAALSQTKNTLKTSDFGSAAFITAEANSRKLDSTLKNIKLSTEGINTKQLASSFAKLGEVVTGSFAVATNAMGAFGKENQDVAEASAKAQQAIAVVMGARAVAEGLVEGKAAARLVVDKITIISNGLLSKTFGEVAVAEAAAATSANALSIAMKAIPIIAIASAIALLVGYLSDWGDEQEDINELLKTGTQNIKDYTDYVTKLADESIKLADIDVEIAKAKDESLDKVQKLEEEAFKLRKKKLEEEFQITLDNEKKLVEIKDKAIDQGDEKAIESANNEVVANRIKSADLRRHLENYSKEEDLFYAKQDETRKNAAKKASTDTQKGYDEIERIISDAHKATLDAENESKLKKETDDAQLIKNLNTREQIIANINIERALFKISEEKKYGEMELKAKGATKEQIERLNEEFHKREIAAIEAGANESAKIEEKFNREKLEVAKILQDEIAYGDFNLSDRRKKIQLEDLEFYNNLAQKKIKSEIASGKLNIDTAKKLTDDLHKLQEEAIENNAKLRKEQNDTDFKKDAENAQKQLDAGVLTTTQHQQVLGDLIKRYAEKNKQIELTAAQETADAKAVIAKQEEENMKKNAETAIKVTQQFATQALAIAAAVSEGKKIALDQELVDLDNANIERENRYNQDYNNNKKALDDQYKNGTLSKSDYDKSITALQKKKDADEQAAAAKLLAAKNAIRKQEFENDKKMKIASTVINTIMGAIAAFTGMAQAIPGPVGLILGGIAAAGVTVAGALAVNNIRKTKFNEEKGPPAAIDTSSPEGGSVVGGSSDINKSSSGGFTGFSPNAVTPPGGSGGGSGGGQGSQGPQRVYVLENDITEAQRRVSLAESNSTFG